MTGPTFRERPIRIGFPLIGNGEWRGGINYQRTLLQAISEKLAERIEARVFVTPEQRDLAQEAFGPWLQAPLIVDKRVKGAGTGRRALGALLTGCDRTFAALMSEHSIDLIFETARFFGSRFPVPALAWMPDFQHRHLPQMFTKRGWWKREIGFVVQSNTNRTIMLSSATARNDCERFYPSTRGRTQVVRFSPSVDAAGAYARCEGARAAYDLPKRFFYMPNQFWAHKNHILVLKALKFLRDQGLLTNLPPVVMSGPLSDYRASGLFEELTASAANEGLSPWFRHLGLIPLGDVLALNAGALAILNPSLFEGWASAVEEAKGLGSPLILSDIPVHREQAPHARYFDPADASDLAQALIEAATSPPERQSDLSTLMKIDAIGKAEFFRAFETAICAAHHLRGNRATAPKHDET